MRVTAPSTCPWLDHPVSGLMPRTKRPIKTRFPCAYASRLKLARNTKSLTHYTKGTRSRAHQMAPPSMRPFRSRSRQLGFAKRLHGGAPCGAACHAHALQKPVRQQLAAPTATSLVAARPNGRRPVRPPPRSSVAVRQLSARDKKSPPNRQAI